MAEKGIVEFNMLFKKTRMLFLPWWGLGKIYDLQKNNDKAKEYYQRSLKIYPNQLPPQIIWLLYAEKGENIEKPWI